MLKLGVLTWLLLSLKENKFLMSISPSPLAVFCFFLLCMFNDTLLFLLPLPICLKVLLSLVLVVAFFCGLRCLTALVGASFLWSGEERLMFYLTDGQLSVHESPRLVAVNDYFVCWLWSGRSYWVFRGMVSPAGFHKLCYGLLKVDRRA